MAWYSLYKWYSPWSKVYKRNWVTFYHNYLYDLWFENLSDEDKEKELKLQEEAKIKREKEFRYAVARLNRINSIIRHQLGEERYKMLKNLYSL